MARRFLSDDEKAAARNRAEQHFTGNGKSRGKGKGKGDEKPKGPRILEDLTQLPGLKPADIRHHFETIKGLKARMDSIKGLYDNARKVCKEAGFDPKVISEMMKIEKGDKEAFALFWRQMRQGMDAVGIESQRRLPFEGEGSGISRAAQIYDDGYKAAKAGKPTSDNPHEESTQAGQTWLHGYHAGSLENAAGIKKTPETETSQDTAH